eukprot:1041630-Amorphochlora_amoeboformis.AAC.1
MTWKIRGNRKQREIKSSKWKIRGNRKQREIKSSEGGMHGSRGQWDDDGKDMKMGWVSGWSMPTISKLGGGIIAVYEVEQNVDKNPCYVAYYL